MTAGTKFSGPQTRGGWVVLGPLSFEVHRWWFRLGVSAGPWYVAAYLGFFVVAIGKRRWLEPAHPPFTVSWTPHTSAGLPSKENT